LSQLAQQRRSSDHTGGTGARLAGGLLIISALAAVGTTVGAVTADPDSRILFRYLAFASALMVFAMAGLYAVRGERGSSDVWRSRLGGRRATAPRDWINQTLAFEDFIEELRRELARARRNDRPCSVLSIRPGSVAGFDDRTVQMFTLDRVSTTFRETDLIAHAPTVPGVFVMLLETNGEGAGIAAERLRRQTADFQMRRGDSTASPLAVQVAAASYPDDGSDANTLLERLGVELPSGAKPLWPAGRG
jgi:hypothetical protein